MDRLSRSQIIEALEALGRRLLAAGAPAELVIVGGAALVVLFDARQSTKDVDAAFFLAGPGGDDVRRAAREVATELGLPADWLNDGAKGYVHGFAPGQVLLDAPGIRVRTLEVRQLLAMKLSAWRDDVDIADARLLLSRLPGIKDAVWAAVEPFLVPGRELKARYAFEDLWELDRGSA